jgi:hypothetical protein
MPTVSRAKQRKHKPKGGSFLDVLKKIAAPVLGVVKSIATSPFVAAIAPKIPGLRNLSPGTLQRGQEALGSVLTQIQGAIPAKKVDTAEEARLLLAAEEAKKAQAEKEKLAAKLEAERVEALKRQDAERREKFLADLEYLKWKKALMKQAAEEAGLTEDPEVVFPRAPASRPPTSIPMKKTATPAKKVSGTLYPEPEVVAEAHQLGSSISPIRKMPMYPHRRVTHGGAHMAHNGPQHRLGMRNHGGEVGMEPISAEVVDISSPTPGAPQALPLPPSRRAELANTMKKIFPGLPPAELEAKIDDFVRSEKRTEDLVWATKYLSGTHRPEFRKGEIQEYRENYPDMPMSEIQIPRPIPHMRASSRLLGPMRKNDAKKGRGGTGLHLAKTP